MSASPYVEQLDPTEVYGQWAPGSVHANGGSVRQTRSSRTQQLAALIEQIGRSEWPVLIVGEPGTGAEVVAQSIHAAAGSSGRYIPINCSLATENELFGLIELANTGTAFLDGIECLPMQVQSELLHVLEHPQFHLIAATASDLEGLTEKGAFSRDLLRCFSSATLHLSPLRESRQDIPMLVNDLLERFGRFTVTNRAMSLLLAYEWPGNVQELRDCVEYMAVVSDNATIDVVDLPPVLRQTVHAKSILPGSKVKSIVEDAPDLWAHALRTFGSSSQASAWFQSECGSLSNRTPIDVLGDRGGEQEVDRILGCIDFGMIA